jgi:DNA-binding CsgD family transcriptional regulator
MDYNLYYQFTQKFAPQGYTGIDPNDPLIEAIGKQIDPLHQTYYVGDLHRTKILYCDKGLGPFIGFPYNTSAEQLDPTSFMHAVHPDETLHHDRALSKLISLGLALRHKPETHVFYGASSRMKDLEGVYNNLLSQAYIFKIPEFSSSVFLLMVVTKIDHLNLDNGGIYYYLGPDRNFFRYPDATLPGSVIYMSQQEFSVIEHISRGLSSKQIADIMFLSSHTINTHRRNVLKKNGLNSINELISRLKDAGSL